MDERSLKIYERLFFVILLILIIIEISSFLSNTYINFSGFRVIFIAVMFIVWLTLIRNKELTTFELILFIMSFSSVAALFLNLFLFMGFFAETIYGIPVFTFMVVLFIAFFIIGLLVFFYRILINSKNQKGSKIKIYRQDILIIITLVIVFTAIGFFLNYISSLR